VNLGRQFDRHGLRQGGPLSPELFVLTVDIIGRLIRRDVDMRIMQQLQHRCNIPSISLYADDVILFCDPTADDVPAVKKNPHNIRKSIRSAR
jgi:hypothetical protein